MNSRIRTFVCNLAVASALSFLSAAAGAMVFEFRFDGVTYDNSTPVFPSLSGTAAFSFNGDPGNGSFALTSLSNVQFHALFSNGKSFALADSEDPLSDVLAVISSNDSSQDR